jgi:hypothetical protein
MQANPSSGIGHEIPEILCNPKVHSLPYSKERATGPYVEPISPVHTRTTYFPTK